MYERIGKIGSTMPKSYMPCCSVVKPKGLLSQILLRLKLFKYKHLSPKEAAEAWQANEISTEQLLNILDSFLPSSRR